MSEVKIQIETEDGLVISKTIYPAVLSRTATPPDKNWDGGFIIGEVDTTSSDGIGENFVAVYLDSPDLEQLQKEDENDE